MIPLWSGDKRVRFIADHRFICGFPASGFEAAAFAVLGRDARKPDRHAVADSHVFAPLSAGLGRVFRFLAFAALWLH
jgi:hypothetical protein